jgi:K+-sensing histidine kinase KdpD
MDDCRTYYHGNIEYRLGPALRPGLPDDEDGSRRIIGRSGSSTEHAEHRAAERNMLSLSPLWWNQPPVILRYAVAVLSVIAALIVLWWMNSVLQAAAHVSLFLCAVMFSAWFGGFKPGLLAIAFSLLTFKYYFLPPIHSLELELTQLPRLVLFALSGLFVASLTAAQRSAAESLTQARDDLQERSRELEIRGRPDTQDGSPAARISVQDRGIGLHAGQADRLFEAFYTTKPHGMGMGLAISRSIIEAHGGRLWAESNQGPGATFSFSLPAAAAGAALRQRRNPLGFAAAIPKMKTGR